MSERPATRLSATVLGAPDPRALAAFYQRLLGWAVTWEEPDWVTLRPAPEAPGLSFQTETDYVPPAWPAEPGKQQMMMHLDIWVEDLDAGVAWAREAGATEAAWQPQDGVRVMLDPCGHPFCLFVQ